MSAGIVDRKGFGLEMTKDDAMAAQLATIGLKTSDIKYRGPGRRRRPIL